MKETPRVFESQIMKLSMLSYGEFCVKSVLGSVSLMAESEREMARTRGGPGASEIDAKIVRSKLL